MTDVRPRETTRLASRTRIVGTAAQLLREHGVGAVTTRAVAEAAGVQPPAIYRLFGDKDGLLDAVAEHELARYVTSKEDAEPTGDPVADLRAAWARHTAFCLANPAVFVLLVDPARAPGSPAAAAGLDVLRDRVRRVAAAGRLRVPEARAVELVHAAGTGAVLALLAVPAERRDPQLTEVLREAVLNTILTDAPAPAGGDATTAAAVTLRAAAAADEGLPGLSASERGLLAEWLGRVADAGQASAAVTARPRPSPPGTGSSRSP